MRRFLVAQCLVIALIVCASDAQACRWCGYPGAFHSSFAPASTFGYSYGVAPSFSTFGVAPAFATSAFAAPAFTTSAFMTPSLTMAAPNLTFSNSSTANPSGFTSSDFVDILRLILNNRGGSSSSDLDSKIERLTSRVDDLVDRVSRLERKKGDNGDHGADHGDEIPAPDELLKPRAEKANTRTSRMAIDYKKLAEHLVIQVAERQRLAAAQAQQNEAAHIQQMVERLAPELEKVYKLEKKKQ